ncbi:alkylated DNA repair protein ALKBH8 homolog isoform X2 [Aristolochia californica]|uniref:alkylated DNA repair protein ALKBH8 homolog isoform X2 n=1 Tax=Aristolochia californica TaxID=171875 RepID=UPI0035D985F9
MADEEQILRAIFGDSSVSEDENSFSCGVFSLRTGETSCWEQIKEINGLWLCRNFLTPERQSSLLSAIESGWFTEASHNQAMRFGDLPNWAIELTGFIRVSVLEFIGDSNKEEPLAPNILWREPLFDQLIVNVYQAGEGICGHTDLLRFDDGIAIVSLESACVMHFTQVGRGDCVDDNVKQDKEICSILKVPVLLSPGTLVLMSGEARYIWKHEINRMQGCQVWEGVELEQKKRTSVTLRKLCRLS